MTIDTNSDRSPYDSPDVVNIANSRYYNLAPRSIIPVESLLDELEPQGKLDIRPPTLLSSLSKWSFAYVPNPAELENVSEVWQSRDRAVYKALFRGML